MLERLVVLQAICELPSARVADAVDRQLQGPQYAVGAQRFRESLRPVLPNLPGDPLVSTWGVERRAEFSALGTLAGCFLALCSGLGLVGTVSARR